MRVRVPARPRRSPRAPGWRRRCRVTCIESSLRSAGEQVDVAVELPEGVGRVPGRGLYLEVPVHLLWSVAVGDVAPVRGDLKLVDGVAGRGCPGQVPGDDATPVVARARVDDP